MERVPTWAKQGVDVRGKKTVQEVLDASGLNFTVAKRPVYYRVGDKHIKADNKFAVVKSTDPNRCYGFVSGGYQPSQNEEGFDFINSINDEIEFLRAGETRNGYIWIIAKMPQIKVLDDLVTPHIIFQNGHNGEIPLQANITLLRIICQNQFTYSFKNAANAIKIRHCGDMGEKLATARDTIQKTQSYIENFQDFAEKFASKKVNDDTLQLIIREMLNEGKQIVIDDSKRGETLEEKISIFEQAYQAPDNANYKGTAYGILNAYTDYSTHLPAMKASGTYEESRFIKNTFKNRDIRKVVRLLEKAA